MSCATSVEVLADDHEVAADRAEDVAGLARAGHGDRLLGRDGDRTLAGVPGGGGHLQHVLVEGAPRLVDRQRGQALDLRGGRDDRDPHLVVGLGGARRDLRDPHRVGVVGQHDDLLGRRLLDRGQDHPGGRPVAGAAVHDDRAGLLEELGQAGAGGDRHDRAAGAGRRPGRLPGRRPGPRSGSPGSGAAGPPRCPPRSRPRRRRRGRGRSRAPRRPRRPASPRARPGWCAARRCRRRRRRAGT